MHNGFAVAFAEGAIELVTMVEGKVIAGERLAAVFIDSLEDLEGVLAGRSYTGQGGEGEEVPCILRRSLSREIGR